MISALKSWWSNLNYYSFNVSEKSISDLKPSNLILLVFFLSLPAKVLNPCHVALYFFFFFPIQLIFQLEPILLYFCSHLITDLPNCVWFSHLKSFFLFMQNILFSLRSNGIMVWKYSKVLFGTTHTVQKEIYPPHMTSVNSSKLFIASSKTVQSVQSKDPCRASELDSSFLHFLSTQHWRIRR